MSEESGRVLGLARAQPEERRGEFQLPSGSGPTEPSLADYLHVVQSSRWLIFGFTLVALLLGVAYVFFATPIYRADVLVQVEEKEGGAGLDELSGMLADKAPAETEMEILRSRMLVGAVVDDLALDTVTLPRRLPIIGGAIARRHVDDTPVPPSLGLRSFAWGGEKIRVERLTVGDRLLEQRMVLTAEDAGRFTVSDREGKTVLVGEVGKAAIAGEGGRKVELFVSELVARPGTQFFLLKLPRENAVADLQSRLRITERGKKTGIIVAAIEGPDPVQAAAIMDAVAQVYLRQNVQRRSAEAEKTLQFIESQLPQLRENLDKVEAQLNAFKLKKGTVDLSLETKGALDRAVDIEKGLTELSLKRQEMLQLFTSSHPAVAALDGKREKLLADKAALDSRLRALPEAEIDAARLMRDAKTASELYFLLVNKAQELRVVKSGTLGNVRILDTAVVPRRPVSPRKAATLSLALFLGMGAGIAASFLRKALDRGVEDPDVVERVAGIPTYAGIPHSSRQEELVRQCRRSGSRARPVLANHDPDDIAMEALRSLRTALQFSLLEAKSNVVAIVGAAPGAGKSFVTVNLGHAIAAMGKRVLVIDADLRRGQMHNYFAGERRGGLSELIVGVLPVEQVVRKTNVPMVDYVSTGALPTNPSELLASERFRSSLDQLAARYDLVLIDTAPVLAVADGAIVGRLAGVSLMVLRAGAHPVREIAAAVKRFRHDGARLHGVILNDVKSSGSYGYSYHYQYEYRSRD